LLPVDEQLKMYENKLKRSNERSKKYIFRKKEVASNERSKIDEI